MNYSQFINKKSNSTLKHLLYQNKCLLNYYCIYAMRIILFILISASFEYYIQSFVTKFLLYLLQVLFKLIISIYIIITYSIIISLFTIYYFKIQHFLIIYYYSTLFSIKFPTTDQVISTFIGHIFLMIHLCAKPR